MQLDRELAGDVSVGGVASYCILGYLINRFYIFRDKFLFKLLPLVFIQHSWYDFFLKVNKNY